MDIKQCLKVFCKLRPSQTTTIKEYVDKPDWVSSDKEVVLLTLSELLILPECTAAVAQCFPGILLELLHRASVGVGNAYEESTFLLMKHEYCCSALSKLASTFPVAKRFAVEYFKTHPSPFFRLLEASYSKEPELKKKKSSLAELCSLSDTEIVCVCYRLILLAFKDFSSLWDWSPFLFYLNHEDNTVKWFASLCVAALFEFSSGQTAMWLQSMFTKDQIVELSVRYGTSHGDETTLQEPTEEILSCLLSSNQSLNSVCLKSTDLINTVTSVGGVLLPNFQQLPSRNDGCLILTPTADKNLHSLVLAIKKGLPVLLQGPLGCGKTSLVEHLAQVTGRTESPHLMKVQLGDQTDSKMLLGTYHCTDVPGEFIWQPGTLLQAVHNGYWLLLEDIDYAPMDVISILVPLLETRTLTLPGNGIIKASPGFQLFATQRLMIGSSGCFKVHSGHVDVLEKLFTKISVQPLSDDELKQVIVTRWPALSNVVNRIVEVYFLVSNANLELHYSNNAGPERSDEKLVDGFSNENLSPYDGRPISTRDLMKWCSRIADYLIGSSEIASLSAFQEALDCFCFSIGNSAKRIIVAEVIAARLNILKAKAEFFCTKHKPFIHITPDVFTVGRVTLPCKFDERSFFRKNRRTFAFTRHASVLLEQIAVAVKNCEPVLLVGETGTGKTATVQFLAEETGHTLVVINMNQQSESADLLGGFKPVDLKLLMNPLKEEYEEMFVKTFSRAQNVAFLRNISTCYNQRRWKDLLALMLHTQKAACHRLQKGENYLLQRWLTIGERISCLETQIKHSENALAFKFIEGSLVKALKTGSWILLDEINLASADTLECLCGLLESIHGSVMLLERGDVKTVNRHPEFKMFACMNPATDVGKKELPPGLRNRFTEFFMEDLEDHSDLCVLVQHYLQGLALSAGQIEGVVSFYLHLRKVAVKDLTDGTGHIPHYSLRTLCRALSYASGNPCKSIPRSLYEAFCLSFLTQLDRSSHPPVENLIKRFILEKQNVKSILHKPLPKPPGEDHALFEGFWILTGDEECVISESYILTPSIRSNLKDLARVAAAGRHPVLLQGGTSVGKTSLIKWLADSSGNRCVRVNNHEHTDLQEYIGSYAANHTGKLVFKEGVLVDAMRNGYWVILDELNLAPTDVLEALNRVLDDNRELFIPETQEVVKAHPRFMLFATQNPPGEYGGRKVLSRAFRNRFIELHFEEIPPQELEIILHKRCSLPPSYCKKLVAVMTDLQTRRSSSGIFAGKHGLITLRDLFRWAERYRFANYPTAKFYDWDQHLADEGYLLLAGRVRKDEETQVIASVIKKHFKCSVNPEKLFTFEMNEASPVIQGVLRQVEQFSSLPTEFGHVVWTFSMRRLAILMGQALQFNEPVLLVGETGCGKTTICQIYAAISGKPLYSVNCHMHSEGADFLGGLRPVRNRDHADDMDMKKGRFFEWANGPLVKAMMDGAVFLADEISLADDSVLERLNSVLEPERTLLLAEKGSDEASDSLVISAEKSFRFVSTMNPGGDYGKKELSPALRNRFTEIWCPSYNVEDDIIKIIEHNLIAGVHLCNQQDGTTGIGHVMLDFLKRFNDLTLGRRSTPSIRDILSWVSFINVATITDSKHCFPIDVPNAYIHGACLVFLDALGSGNSGNFSAQQIQATKLRSLHMLLDQIEHLTGIKLDKTAFGLHDKGSLAKVVSDDHSFGVIPFIIAKGPACCQNLDGIFTLKAPTSCMNALRVLRALQLIKPILLEGSPGVGKTSLVIALAKASGHNFVRINLSEQTDISDLFGADLPVEGGRGGQFAWHDGPLLRALKSGDWIILDELNLASQSVLEGLNACLDHRGEIYVPELGRTFSTPKYACRRIFACQNPLVQGGARKGLPKSFLNRFTQVYIESLSSADLELITCTMYPEISAEVIHSIVSFNQKMHVDMVVNKTWGTIGGPWEINLRDIFRWCDLVAASKSANPGEYVPLIYASRMRTTADRIMVLTLCNETFGDGSTFGSCHLSVTSGWLQVGSSILPRAAGSSHHVSVCTSLQSSGQLYLLPTQLQALQSLMKCVEMNWMSILVGPPSSGKSSLVSLIAGMTGNSLHVLSMNSDMDTTELLGGFEQTDLNRRLSYLSGDVYSVFNKIVAHLLISEKSFKEVQHLMESWARYESLQKTGRYGTTKEEAAHFLQKVNRLKETIRQLQQHQLSIANLSCLFEKLENLEKLVMQEEAVNCGGQFEWVDSLLVTALQKGHWLLIDNVNFCSPSVLDRLNGLLEPNGILTISERGLCDGEIPTYKPHPNFRLFLSMDPRNGEISRAMRNRGIEIYLGVEEVSPKVRMLELKTLLDDAQLYSLTAQKLLIKIHDSVTETFVGGDKPSINDLLRITHLTVQRMQEGEDISLAVWESCMEVYVHCQNVTVRKERAKCVIEDLLSGPGMKLSFSSDFHCYSNTFLPSPLLAVKEFAFLPELAKIKQDSSCLTYLICLIVCVTDDQKASIEVQKFLCEMLHYEGGMPSLKNLLDHIFVALKMFMLGSSFDNWQLRSQFFKSFLTRVMKSVCKNDCLKGIFNQLLSLAEYALDCACVTFSSEPAKNLLKKLESLFDNDEGVAVKEISFDLRWNQKLLNHLILKKVKPDTNPSYLLETLFSLANRCNVLFEFLLWRTSVVKELQDSVTVTNKQSPKQTSLLLMSFSRCKGVESFQNVPKILIDNLANFFLTLFDAMQKILSSCNPFPDDILMKWKVAIHWVARFWIACSESFPGNYLPSHHTTVLYLHWMWMSKKAFAVFFGDNWTLDKLRVYPSLWPIIEKLEEHFKTHVIHVNPLSYKVHQIIGHPHPYRSLSEAEINDSLQRIWLKAIGANPENCQLGSLVLFSCDALLAHRDKMKDIFTGDSDMQNDKLQNLEEQSVTLFTAFMNVHKQADLQWQFLPVVEHMALLKEQRCACLLLSKNTTDALLEICMARSLAHLTNFASPFHLAVIERLSRSDVGNVDDAVLLEYQYEYLNSIWHCSLPEAERPMNSKYVGPALLHSPVTNIVAAHILSDLLDASAIPSCKMLNPSSNVSLGSCSEKIKHLQDVSNLLWNYTEAAHGVNHDPLINDCSLFFATFLQLSLLLIEIADDKTQQNSSKDLHMLKTLNPRNLSQMADAMPIIQHISIYVSECGIILDELNKIWLHLTEDVISFLKSKSFMLKSIEDNIEMRDFVASAWIYLGYLQAILSIPIFDADPALRHKMKLAFFKEQEHSASVDLFIANVQSYLITGQQLAPSLTCKLHPMLELSQKCISEANPAIKNLERDQAVRPIPSQYEALRNEMIQYIETVGSGKNVLLFVEELKKFKKQKSKCCQSVCERVQGWIASQHSFLKKISCSYPWYRDLTLPSAVGILQMLHGMALLIYFTEREMQLNDLGIKVADLVETVQLLSAFPNISVSYLSSFALSRCLQNPVVKTIIFLLFSSEDCKAKANRHYLRILKSSLMEIWNQASTAGYLHKEELKFLHDTLHIFVLSWQHQEKERLNKEAEKESLYQYKGRDYGEIIDDEAQLQKSIKMTFPTYDEAFSDLTRLNDLEEQMNYDSLKNVDDDTVASDISGSITQQEFEDIVSAHNKLFIRYTACDWHQVEHSNYRPDFLMPLTVRYPVVADIVAHFGDILGKPVDASLINVHLVMSSVHQGILKPSSEMVPTKDCGSSYDFYYDSNITEVTQCRPILENFQKRVVELLLEWEEHPALKQLLKIINRILSFPATSPVMKFVTGLELLLAQAQDWEKNAHKGVSLFDHLEAVTKQIIQWRKLELSCWASYLDLVEWRTARQASRWWFYVYATTESWLSLDTSVDLQQDKNPAKTSLNDLCTTLQQFMETSPLGEFKERLDIFLAFACHLVHVPSSHKQRTLVSVFWNLYQYYKQFVSAVSLKICMLREPIVKELKDFIKISRWNDINFWAVKESVDKSHRTIHKHIRQYENCLKQLSHTAFSDADLLSKAENITDSATDFSDVKEKRFAWTSSTSSDNLFCIVDSENNPADILQRLPTLYGKAMNLCKKLTKKAKYSSLVATLDHYIGEIIANVHELQSLEINRTASKERQAVEAKNINLRKRKALSDLFKTLSVIGLSYRKGQLYYHTEGSWNVDIFTLPPLNCEAHYLNVKLSELDSTLLNVWKDCPQYFLRSFSRMALLQLSIQNPSKEIGPSNLQRCIGFSSHLLHMCIEQRRDLCNAFSKMIHLKTIMQYVEVSHPVLSAERLLLPPQESFKQWVVVLLDHLAQALQGLGQFVELLNSCPPSTDSTVINALLLNSPLDGVSQLRRGDPSLVDAISKVETCIHNVKEIQGSLSEEKMAAVSDTLVIWTWENVHRVTLAFKKLRNTADLFPLLHDGNGHSLLALLGYLKDLIISKAEQFNEWIKNYADFNHEEAQRGNSKLCDCSHLKKHVYKAACVLANKVLLGIQNLYKTEVTIQNLKKDSNLEGPSKGVHGKSIPDLEKGILVTSLHAALKNCLLVLDIDHIDASFTKLVCHWKAATDSSLPFDDINECTKFLLQSLPLINRYMSLVQFYFILLLKSHRVTAKMSSVLLGIFTELIQKGFCLPAEFSDLSGGEGSTKFEDIEGGGIGEGDGIKDVSDRIENEDQLEEAHQEGTEKQEQDAGDGPDIKDEENGIEMSEDFAGKLHDLDDNSQDESENESDKDNELDKQKGNLEGEDDAEKLDERIWGDDHENSEDDDEDEDDDDDKEDEYGPGDGPQEESRLVAKSDLKPSDKIDDKDTDEKNDPEDENKDISEQINMIDEREFDDHPDQYYNKQDEIEKQESENMDLADDLKLDNEENGEGEPENEIDEGKEENIEADAQDSDEGLPDIIKEEQHLSVDDEQTANDSVEKEKQEEVDGDEDSGNTTDNDSAKPEIGSGLEADDELGPEENEDSSEEKAVPAHDIPLQNDLAQPADDSVKKGSSDRVENANHSALEDGSSAINDNPNEETAGFGQSEADTSDGHDGKKSKAKSQQKNLSEEAPQHSKTRPGQSNEKRSLGSVDQPFVKRLKTEDGCEEREDVNKEKVTNDVYEHIKNADMHHDCQVLDAATEEQVLEQPIPIEKEDDAKEDLNADDDVEILEDEKTDDDAATAREKKPLDFRADQKRDQKHIMRSDVVKETDVNIEQGIIDGEQIETTMVERGPDSTIHTHIEHWPERDKPLDIEKLRQELEEQVSLWSTTRLQPSDSKKFDSKLEIHQAVETWHKYEEVTLQLAQDLCEKLRLILEPSLTAKLKGDYRTGKRLNMRKVIPYVASQFRKDKIWLRRTKPSKRDYQIMLAIDDSSSMADNHSKQLAFEALAVINKSLMLLEAGEVAIASFGENVHVVHQFGEQFTGQTGAAILQQFTFQQKKTKVSLVLDHAVTMMLDSRQRRRSGAGRGVDMAQLLIIVSDGRGVFSEGVDVLKKAVRRARDGGVFVVFVALDNPVNKYWEDRQCSARSDVVVSHSHEGLVSTEWRLARAHHIVQTIIGSSSHLQTDSIFDIRVPVFKGAGQLPEIKSYMDDFPFPFYLILRDINSLPAILSDALRQWFEFVNSSER